MTTLLTSNEELRGLFSNPGLIAFADMDCDGVADEDVMNQAILKASAHVGGKLRPTYEISKVVDDPLVRHWAKMFAACALCVLRGNPVPETWAMECQEIRDEFLNPIAADEWDGELSVPKRSSRLSKAPTYSNAEVNLRCPSRPIRVTGTSVAGRHHA
ncbi:MAG: hypothetical protein AAFP90_21965 [Planctomycetota bacterium]